MSSVIMCPKCGERECEPGQKTCKECAETPMQTTYAPFQFKWPAADEIVMDSGQAIHKPLPLAGDDDYAWAPPNITYEDEDDKEESKFQRNLWRAWVINMSHAIRYVFLDNSRELKEEHVGWCVLMFLSGMDLSVVQISTAMAMFRNTDWTLKKGKAFMEALEAKHLVKGRLMPDPAYHGIVKHVVYHLTLKGKAAIRNERS